MTPEDLLPQVYQELRQLAQAKLAFEKVGHTLDATALVHEAFLKLGGEKSFTSKSDYLKAAATAMRRILVDHARTKAALKRGGDGQRVPISDFADSDADERLLHLDEALTMLAKEDDMAARVVELHHFAGLNHQQVADSLNISVYQARLKWDYARAWLKSALGNSGDSFRFFGSSRSKFR